MSHAAASPVAAEATTAIGAVIGAFKTFSATSDTAAATVTLGEALLAPEPDAAGGLGDVLAFFFFLSKPNKRCVRTRMDKVE